MIKKTGLFILSIMSLVILIFVGKASILPGPTDLSSINRPDNSDELGYSVAENLAKAIRFKTISVSYDVPYAQVAFEGFHKFLEDTYPNVHSTLKREVVGPASLLYHWKADQQLEKRPIAFLAHMDVVPVEGGTESGWSYPAFDGEIKDGFVWGRGSSDNKMSVITLMESVERLIKAGFKPSRDIYFAFGHDEEIGGRQGAKAIVDLLEQRGIELDWTLDEGSGIADGIIAGLQVPVALISLAEKGSVTLKLTATSSGGHSSTPAPDTAISIVGRAVGTLAENQYPLEMTDAVREMLQTLVPEYPYSQKVVLANLWVFEALVTEQIGESRVMAASLRTTTAPTIFHAGTKSNILPQKAEAYVNFRIHPRDSVMGVLERAKAVINDPRVTVTTEGGDVGSEPTKQSSFTSDGFAEIKASIGAVFGEVPVVPSLTVAGTDSKHYARIAENTYRFNPYFITSDDLKRVHGTDERISIGNLAVSVRFYEDIIKRSAS
ncbi:M20 family peptidase [Kordiimonas sp. SCSIO 12610]|uniref:M20 family peptidase n=1 Tax=Kordiimonas sp. SCSIO 12610 TaxID=2829597 RepID=UPI002108E910|nr:M20 family peptidase [Kordiimonas sp. SCSIO 12610]UTW55555.1 M20 family peptidase [Kordiimonas sp. SCSIO 12610]